MHGVARRRTRARFRPVATLEGQPAAAPLTKTTLSISSFRQNLRGRVTVRFTGPCFLCGRHDARPFCSHPSVSAALGMHVRLAGRRLAALWTAQLHRLVPGGRCADAACRRGTDAMDRRPPAAALSLRLLPAVRSALCVRGCRWPSASDLCCRVVGTQVPRGVCRPRSASRPASPCLFIVRARRTPCSHTATRSS